MQNPARPVLPALRRALVVATVAAGGLVAVAGPAHAAVSVATEAELRAAFGDLAETDILLTADITIACDGDNQITRVGGGADLTIDGNGHTITFPCDDGAESLFLSDGPEEISFQLIELVDTGGGYAAAFTVGPAVFRNAVVRGWQDAVRSDRLTVSGSVFEGATGSSLRPDEDADVWNSFISGANGLSTTGTVNVINTTFGGSDIAMSVSQTTPTLTHVTFHDNGTHIEATGARFTMTGVALGTSSGPACDLGGNVEVASSYSASIGDCALDGVGDSQGVAASAMTFGALGGLDGSTPGFTPSEGSVLVDAIPAADCPSTATPLSGDGVDQLGTTRPQGAGCDIGSVERVAATPPAPGAPSTPATPGSPTRPTPATPRPSSPAAPTTASPRFTG